MLSDLPTEQKTLAELMSDISERCQYAGWLLNLEYVLWDAIISGPRQYGHDTITQHDIDLLIKHRDKANCWIYFDDESEETAIGIMDWEIKFKIDISTNPDVLGRYLDK